MKKTNKIKKFTAAKATVNEKANPLFGFSKKGWISSAKLESKKGKKLSKGEKEAVLYVLGSKAARKACRDLLKPSCSLWQLNLIDTEKSFVQIQTDLGLVWLLKGNASTADSSHHYGMLEESQYANLRDLSGKVLSGVREAGVEHLSIDFIDCNHEQKKGFLVGLELASYSFFRTQKKSSKNILPELALSNISKDLLEDASNIGIGVNVARHLVNAPASHLNPESYATFVNTLFARISTTKVTVWDEARILKEKLNLLHTVGRAGEHPSKLIHIAYRPKAGRKSSALKPLAFVGKGITFDTGGLDLKPSNAMRLMKKDMGGSASLVGLAWWLQASQCDVPCDIYLAVAENAVAGGAMRPGDILQARNGLSVEIHNTDAEGRLVLGDALLVATSKQGKDKPQAIIDLATLTGAMRVALGTKVAGLCSNSDVLADAILTSGQRAGDPCWRMPLIAKYEEMLKSSVADISNASSTGFGGGITAALFLQKFIGPFKWAHIDMMAWAEKPEGAIGEVGGNGQMVQALADFLTNYKAKTLQE
ncbi:MAG: leucyl aminopeptidase family protein [Bdellovibrionota bacterium]